MPLPRLCVLDVDGTLLNSRHQVTVATRAAIEHVRSRDVQVILASSRGPGALAPVLAAINAPVGEMFIASQGAVSGRVSWSRSATGGPAGMHALSLDLQVRHPMSMSAARALTARALAHSMAVSWFVGSAWLVSHMDDTVSREAAVVGTQPTRVGLDGAPAPDKVMLVTSDVPVLVRLASSLPSSLQAQMSNAGYLEVTARGVSKAAALRTYCARARISAGEVVAFGDGPNDVDLLTRAGTAVVPSSGSLPALAVADQVARSNDKDGIAAALEEILSAGFT
jgi:hydroxymethylpyrimidine pyrophosphatase-like HAD family hydrolase